MWQKLNKEPNASNKKTLDSIGINYSIFLSYVNGLMCFQGSEALHVDESSNDASQLVVDDIFPVTPKSKYIPRIAGFMKSLKSWLKFG